MALTKITSAVIDAGAISTASIADTSITADKLAATLDLTGKTLTVATATAGDNDTTVASTAFVSTAIASIDTDDVSEGSSNLYFTDEKVDDRVNALLTAGTGITLTYNDAANTLTIAGSAQYGDSDVESYLSGGTGVTFSSGVISIGQDVATSSTPTFGNITTTGYIAGPATFTIDPAAVGDNTGTVVIAGNLQVDGTTTTINSTTMTVDDLNITLASGAANAAAANGAGITVDGASATITYDGTNDEWDFNKNVNVTGTITASGNITGTLATAAQTNITSVGTLTGFTSTGIDDNATSTAITINGSENVGINVSSPGRKFEVNSGGQQITSVFSSNSTTAARLSLKDANTTGDNYVNVGAAGDDFVVYAGAQEKLRVDSSGNVGIGTTSPSANLHVSSSGDTIARITSADGNGAFLDLGDASDPDGGRIVYDSGSNLGFSTASTERMRIDSSGRLLVGKTAVDNTTVGFRFDGSSGFASFVRDGGESLYLNRKTSDGEIVKFAKDGTVVGSIFSSGSIQIGIGDGDTALLFADNISAVLPWSTANTAENGTIDLGRSSTKFKDAYLSGTASIGNLTIAGSQGSDGQVLTSTGSGIAWEDASGGATDINGLSDAKTFGTGSIMLGDTTTGTLSNANYNVGVGVDMLNSLTSGYANIAIGFESCKDLTTGHNNVAVGHATLYENIGGEQNVAIGSNALQNNTSGNYNIAVGKSALKSNTTGNENTAVGIEALFTQTAGVGYTAVGRVALRANTANNNTAVGTVSLFSNTSGASNTALGAYALQSNTTASNNTAVGYGALLANTASSNTAVGYNALTTTTTATQVTALGFRAGEDSTGNSNTFIGFLAGAENSTGNQNTFIGASTAESGVCTGIQNTLVGGNNATGITSGADNTVLGTHAARNLTTGAGHVAIGTHARRLAAAGNNGVYVGIYSGYNHTAGRSVYVGEYAGYDATSSDDSVHVGRMAGQNVTTGYTNVCMGDRALNAATTGYANTCIGYKAGDNITTGYAHTLIGNAVRSAYASNSSGEIGLGVGISTNGTGYFTVGSGSNKGYYLYGSTNGFTAGSDERLKEEITDSTVGLSFINDLRPRTFKWKKRKDIPSDMPQYEEASEERHLKLEKVQLGMIAQEVKTVIDNHSELPAGFSGWTTDVEGTQCLDYVGFIQPLIKAVQELSTKLDAAEARIASLEGE